MTTKSHCTFNPDYYQDVWQRFGEEEYDVVVIGGGSVGAGAGLDAAIRGLKVAVVESRDFAAGTSSRSSKMFHGGLRYLAMLDFKLVAESLHERELNMSTLAPHLVKPLKFLFPPHTPRVGTGDDVRRLYSLRPHGRRKISPHAKALLPQGNTRHGPRTKRRRCGRIRPLL
ncbi:FAD-dependent oxidoreductase [Corynebacterium diphtheriae bv. gravis]|nr:FAD-dependent oxidoreductase [Corynebacterium diphtheriae bv. gravis]